MFRPFALLAFCVALTAGENSASTTIVIDGSSTVYPITVAIGERYASLTPNVGIEVLCSGTTAGFRRLVSGEVPISGASRPIKADELAKAAKAGIEIVELPVSFDGLSVVVNKSNTFVDSLTIAELKKIWEPDSTVKSWRQVRASFPDLPITLYGAGKDSGTFDYFTEVIVGTARSSREDYVASEDDNDLVQGVVRNRGALGYFGMSYLLENEALLKAVPIDGGKGPVPPSMETVADSTYSPLSRPLFIYVNKAALSRREVQLFVEAYIAMAPAIAPQVGYVPFSRRTYDLVSARLAARTAGSIYTAGRQGARLDELLMAQSVTKESPKEPTNAKIAPLSQPSDSQKEVKTPVKPVVPATAATAATAAAATATATTTATPTGAPVAKPAVKEPVAPTLALARTPAPVIDERRLDHLRDRAIQFARLTLDDAASLPELQARIEELRLLAAGMAGPSSTSIKDLPDDQAGFIALIERLNLTVDGRSLLDEAALMRLKQTLSRITDNDTRRALALALLRPGPDQLPSFTAAISAANGGQADVDAVLCYARGGFVLR